MPSPLSVDLRERVVAAVASGASCRRAAARFGVSVSSASRWCGQSARDGHVAPKLMGVADRSGAALASASDVTRLQVWARSLRHGELLPAALCRRIIWQGSCGERHPMGRVPVSRQGVPTVCQRDDPFLAPATRHNNRWAGDPEGVLGPIYRAAAEQDPCVITRGRLDWLPFRHDLSPDGGPHHRLLEEIMSAAASSRCLLRLRSTHHTGDQCDGPAGASSKDAPSISVPIRRRSSWCSGPLPARKEPSSIWVGRPPDGWFGTCKTTGRGVVALRARNHRSPLGLA
ncbi:hypothetical protein LDDCCGHA_5514 [Methylobacterium oxalidis]|nr:hypothetical protein LDDCCGHA_5514 [Methylobacterium oxalidis]